MNNPIYQKGYEAGLLRAYELARENEESVEGDRQLPLFPTHELILNEINKSCTNM